jgi:hypothetical protein
VARDIAAVVVQPAIPVPCYLGDPGHIASHSKLVVLAVAGVVVVLRFPLSLLYRFPFNEMNIYGYCCSCCFC